MKKILFILGAWVAVGQFNYAGAQCTISQSSILINIKSVTANPGGGCTARFDLTYDIANNGGNKWSYIHVWDATAYPGISYPNGPGPKKAELNGGPSSPTPLLQTVATDYVSGAPVISASYGPDNNIVPQTTNGISVTRTVLPNGNQRFYYQNIVVVSANCNPLNLIADVWSAQDDNGKNVACGVSGLTFRVDEPLLRGLIGCGSIPRTYTISIQTKTTRSITFTAYKDVAPFGVFDANDELNIVDGPRTVSNTGDPSGVNYNTFGPYPIAGSDVNGTKFDIWIVAVASGLTNSNAILVTNTCTVLPVEFASFTANRTGETVSLTWETATEQDVAGFGVERNSNGIWQQVAYINTLANGGNSNMLLRYTYNDLNATKGITQYRIRQVDLSGQFRYSEVRVVRYGTEKMNTVVYPNPTSTGSFTVVFPADNLKRDITILDASGRSIKTWKEIANNNLSITNLNPGIYMVQIIAPETGEQVSKKVVVLKQ